MPESTPTPPFLPFFQRPVVLGAMLLLAVVGIGLNAARTYYDYAPPQPEFQFEHTGMLDFHNGGYFPAKGFRHGINPYSAEIPERYPTPSPAPLYSPVIFMLHVPFSYLEVKEADIIYFLFNLGVIALLAAWALLMSNAPFRWFHWLGILGLIVISRPGHVSLYTGYFTPLLVLGSILALHFGRTKPSVAAFGILLASGKPTYIIPLVILMLFRRNYRAVMGGIALSGLVAAAGLGWLAWHSSPSDVLAGIEYGQATFRADVNEIPVNTWTRLDVVGALSKIMEWDPPGFVYLATMLAFLILPCLAIAEITRSEKNPGATGLTALIAVLAILLSIYHHAYDGLLVAVPWVGITFFGASVCPELSTWQRRMISLLLAIVAGNYVSTLKVRGLLNLTNQDPWWDGITAINTVCLLLALLIAIVAAFRPADSPET